MPSRVIKVSDPHAFPYEFGFEPTEPPEGGFAAQVGDMGRLVRQFSPGAVVVTSASGDPGGRPLIKHLIPNGDGVGASMLYVRADSQESVDLAAAAEAMHAAVLAIVGPMADAAEE